MAKPKRPDKYPLWWHAGAKAWCKKIKGKHRYFGADKDEALTRFCALRDAIKEGRDPSEAIPATTDLSVKDLVNKFLTAKRERVDSGELTASMWGEYFHMSEQVVSTFGRQRLVSELRPDDFGRLRAAAAKRLGPGSLKKFITMAMTLFKFAYTSELIPAPVRFGDRFDKPSKRVLRLKRAEQGVKLLTAADIWQLIGLAEPQFRAMLWLAINCGFGAKDCAELRRSSLATVPGWIITVRNKTGTPRQCPLWPETIAALAAVEAIRPEAKNRADDDLVFLTKQGNRWVRYVDKAGKRGHNVDTVGRHFQRLTGVAKIKAPGGFYVMRHVFRTVADAIKDRPAIDLLMGHSDHTMAQHYRENIAEERLTAVTDHVHKWLLDGKPQAGSQGTSNA